MKTNSDQNSSRVSKCWRWAFCVSLFAAQVAAQPHASRETDVAALELRAGGIVRGPQGEKRLALVFTGHEFGESASTILDELAKYHAKASFFLTGTFLTNAAFTPVIRRIVADGHYLGPHSDQHLLYCSWDTAHKTLLTFEEFKRDLLDNVDKVAAFGVPWDRIRYFLPAYEHYNEQIADWTKKCGLKLVNFTPGTRSNADYTGESERNFVSSKAIFESIIDRSAHDPHGLNGYLLLLHVGAGPGRTDKFHTIFGRCLDRLATEGYHFVRVDDLLESQTVTANKK